MVEQNYGRIVMTTSTGMLGLPTNTSYATAKAGVIGLTRSLATAGAPHGIKVNLIAPAAMTRMAGAASDDPQRAPELVAPMAAYLAHESCPVSGEIYTAGFGRFARLFIASTVGYVHAGPQPTMEDVARNWETINDETGYFVPDRPHGLVGHLHVPPAGRGPLGRVVTVAAAQPPAGVGVVRSAARTGRCPLSLYRSVQ